VEGKDTTIRGRVIDEEDDAANPAISLLQLHPALECLDVPEARLGFDRGRIRLDEGDEVPGSPVALDRKWDLGPDRDRARQKRPQARDQGELGAIADGIAIGICAAGKPEADGSTRATELLDGHVGDGRALDPSELGVGHPDGCPGRSQTDPRGDSCLVNFAADLGSKEARGPCRIARPSPPRRHRRCRRARHRQSSAGSLTVPSVGRRARGRPGGQIGDASRSACRVRSCHGSGRDPDVGCLARIVRQSRWMERPAFRGDGRTTAG
jgi:hypothetical protein